MREELHQTVEKKVWEYRKSLNGERALRSMMFISEKKDARGELMKIKARLVADGSSQILKPYQETSSPTASFPSIMSILKIAAVEKRKLVAIDIGGAYLNASMDEEVYMIIDKQVTEVVAKLDVKAKTYVRKDGTLAVKLKKALYGCKQSAVLWFKRLKAYLEKLGFTGNLKDKCVFNLNRNSHQVTIVFHVDDLLITSGSSDNLNWIKKKLRDEIIDSKEQHGDEITYLGMLIRRKKDDGVSLSMDKIVDEVLEGVEGVVKTLATDDLFKVDSKLQPLPDPEKEVFHSMVAKLLYLAMRTRPDLLLAVSFLTTRVTKATEEDMKKLNRVVSYMNGTKRMSLESNSKEFKCVEGYVDAAFGKHVDGKSHTGMIIMIGETTVAVKSGKQKIVTKDSTEAE